jgi:hypothetical protein
MMSLIREWIASPSYSSRGGATVDKIVLHTAEGARTIESLGSFFANGANQVSSHTGADNQKGRIGEYVTRGNKAWTAANYNPYCVQLELCGFASWTRDIWMNQNRNMLNNCAQWIAEESAKFGIPITKLTPGQAQGNGRGVCQHVDLGAGGGGHHNCGPGFPMDDVLKWAREGQPKPPPDKQFLYYDGDHTMQLQFSAGSDGNAPRALVVIPNQHSDGKSRMVFGCAQPSALRVDMMGFGATANLDLSSDMGRQGFGIQDGCHAVTVRRDSGTEPVSMDYSRNKSDM